LWTAGYGSDGCVTGVESVGNLIGLKEYPITHVQGSPTIGHRLEDESKITIVALMRGGEPLVLGVNDAFPLAMFVHANDTADLELHHLQGQKTVVLVDSVVNSGTTIVKFVKHILQTYRKVRIVIATGVVHRECISKGGAVYNPAARTNSTLVTLRISDNKFIGRGTTDTGNRLFNTTGLPWLSREQLLKLGLVILYVLDTHVWAKLGCVVSSWLGKLLA
jgi:uracil phosphoribosyltransferase